MRMYQTPEVMALLGISYSTLRSWRRLGKITEIKTPGGHYRYFAREIDAIRRRGKTGAGRWQVPKGSRQR
jgi:predicted site-specific integrase-resolvase